MLYRLIGKLRWWKGCGSLILSTTHLMALNVLTKLEMFLSPANILVVSNESSRPYICVCAFVRVRVRVRVHVRVRVWG